MRDSVAEDAARTARRSPMFAAPAFPGLRDTSVLQDAHALPARPLERGRPAAHPNKRLPGCLVGSADWAEARDTTGAKLFLSRTREDAAGAPAVDSVSVPGEPLQNP